MRIQEFFRQELPNNTYLQMCSVASGSLIGYAVSESWRGAAIGALAGVRLKELRLNSQSPLGILCDIVIPMSLGIATGYNLGNRNWVWSALAIAYFLPTFTQNPTLSATSASICFYHYMVQTQKQALVSLTDGVVEKIIIPENFGDFGGAVSLLVSQAASMWAGYKIWEIIRTDNLQRFSEHFKALGISVGVCFIGAMIHTHFSKVNPFSLGGLLIFTTATGILIPTVSYRRRLQELEQSLIQTRIRREQLHQETISLLQRLEQQAQEHQHLEQRIEQHLEQQAEQHLDEERAQEMRQLLARLREGQLDSLRILRIYSFSNYTPSGMSTQEEHPPIPEHLIEDPVLQRYICPISHEPIRYPVLDPTNGISLYDLSALMRFLIENDYSPTTHQPLFPAELILLPALERFIASRIEDQSTIDEELQREAEEELERHKKEIQSRLKSNSASSAAASAATLSE